MSKKDKVILALVLITILLLIFLSFVATYKVAELHTSDYTKISYDNVEMSKKIDSLEKAIKSMPTPQDGYTPVKGVDYFDGASGKDGANGSNALSYNTTETVIKEVPVNGMNGKDGADAPRFEMQLSPTGDLQTKYSDSRFWQTLIPCNKLLIVCPGS